jgi:hypothetical protein
MGKRRAAYKILMGKPEGSSPPGRTRRRWRIIIKWIFKRLYGGHGLDTSGSELGQVAGSCECGEETFRSNKTREIS